MLSVFFFISFMFTSTILSLSFSFFCSWALCPVHLLSYDTQGIRGVCSFPTLAGKTIETIPRKKKLERQSKIVRALSRR